MKSYHFYFFCTLIVFFSVLLVVDCIAQCSAPDILGDKRWYGTSPQVLYIISTLNKPSYLDTNGVISHMQAAASSWSMAGTNFDFLYNGTNQAFVDTRLAECTARTNPNNLIGWGDLGSLYRRPDGTLTGGMGEALVCVTEQRGSSGRWLIDFVHAILNYNIDDGSGSYRWSLNPPPPQPGNYQFDVQSISAHEFGHWLTLNDVARNKYPSWPTMEQPKYDLLDEAGKIDRRSPECEDQWGVNTIYDGSPSAPPFIVSRIHHNKGNPNLIPRVSILYQNVPNPANPETWIPFELYKDSVVTIHIYNAQVQLVRTLALGRKEAGYYIEKPKAAYWNGRNDAGELVSSGVYFYQLQAEQFSSTRKMLILK